MQKFGISQPIRRVEDVRFLTGAGRYLDDAAPEGALVGYFIRSPVAHGILRGLDAEAARALPGVSAVLTADDLKAAGVTNHIEAMRVKNRDGSRGAGPQRPVLAEGRVRHLGEPVALVLAETLAQARDAAEAIDLDIEELPVKTDLAPGGPELHEGVPGNLAYDWAYGDAERVAALFEGAAHVVRLEVGDQRVAPVSLEPRGCFAEWRDERLHLTFSGQGVWGVKAALSKVLGLTPEAVHVSIPDVGGGFGMKVHPYPEYFAVAAAARAVGRAVRWVSDRSEAMLSDTAGRDLVSLAEAAFDADLRLVAYRVASRSNLGAYNSNFGQNIQSELSLKVLTGAYAVRDVHFAVQGLYTNTAPVDAYRGAGRPEIIYVLERLMDRAARELGVSPFDLRRRNFI
ncbi:MAG: xanthine dehydrogenase, partial [Alphaproteobacteria bacterium HGW-Alphaproteobacteria-2]